jgi:uncharacterized protein
VHKVISLASAALALVVGLLARPIISPSANASVVSAAAGFSAAPQTQPAGSGAIRTSGTAVIRVQPDRASIRFGVQTFGSSPRSSQAENEAIAKRVYQAIRDQGVEAKDIGTDYFTVRPEYDYPGRGKQTLLGYWSENGIQVTLRQVDKLSEVLVAALDAGATSVDDLSFTTTRLRELRDQARAMAVQAAIEKAQALAGAAHVPAGGVQNIGEQSWSYYYGGWNNRGQYMSQVQNVMQEAAPSGSAPAVDDGEFSLGQIVVQAQVDVSVGINQP